RLHSYRHLLCPLTLSYTAPPTTHIYTLSLHDALPICPARRRLRIDREDHQPGALYLSQHSKRHELYRRRPRADRRDGSVAFDLRSEEHTSELQSRFDLVCRLLLEKKKKNKITNISIKK